MAQQGLRDVAFPLLGVGVACGGPGFRGKEGCARLDVERCWMELTMQRRVRNWNSVNWDVVL